VDQNSDARLILPSGLNGPAFLTFPNHMAIRAYNNSTSYAWAWVCWPTRSPAVPGSAPPGPPSSRFRSRTAERRRRPDAARLQSRRHRRVVGAGTRTALRAWQQARGRPATGYLDSETIGALRREAGL
jgi:peptidoglycan hydrolase-like protein with peptidoglycan-binding domain